MTEHEATTVAMNWAKRNNTNLFFTDISDLLSALWENRVIGPVRLSLQFDSGTSNHCRINN